MNNTIDESAVPNLWYAEALDVVCDPKRKLTNRQRKRYRNGMAGIARNLTPAAKDPFERASAKIETLSMVGVIRLLKKSARRAATAKYLLEKTTLELFRRSIASQQERQLWLFQGARLQYHARLNPVKGSRNDARTGN